MRSFSPMTRRLRPFVCAGVWLACLAGAAWLYLDNGGPAEAVAIAETKTYRVSAAQLGRVTAVEVVEGQMVTAGQVVARLSGAVLKATATAYVTTIHARPGDVIRAGQPVVTLVEAQPRQVIAYVDERRRDLSFAPGTKVLARRRDARAASVQGTVANVGGDVAVLPQRLWVNPHVPTWGRAVYIDIPAEAALAPGEIVEIRRSSSALVLSAETRPSGSSADSSSRSR